MPLRSSTIPPSLSPSDPPSGSTIPRALNLMRLVILPHNRHPRRALRTEGVVLELALDVAALRIGDVVVLVARVVLRRPVYEPVPALTLAGLVAGVLLPVGLRGHLVPGCVVRVAVDVLQQAVEAVLDVRVEVRFLRGAAVGGGGVSLDFDLRWV